MSGWYFTKSIQTIRMWLEKHISIASRPLTLNRRAWSHLTHSRINFHPSSWLLFYLRSGIFKEYYVLFYLILTTCYHQCPPIDDNTLLLEIKFRLILLFKKKSSIWNKILISPLLIFYINACNNSEMSEFKILMNGSVHLRSEPPASPPMWIFFDFLSFFFPSQHGVDKGCTFICHRAIHDRRKCGTLVVTLSALIFMLSSV